MASFWRRVWNGLNEPLSRKDSGESLREWLSLYSGRTTKSGMSVTLDTALTVSTVLACCNVKANGIAQVPLKLYRGSPTGREEATDHPLYSVLYARANQWQTSFDFRRTIGFHLSIAGNSYSFKNIVRGKIVELIPFEPNTVGVIRASNGTLTYRVTPPSGASQDFPEEAIWHIRGLSWKGYIGMDALQLTREAIGLALVTEDAHARLHSNGARVGGVYSVEGKLDKPQYEALRDWITLNHVGPENASTPMILDRAAKWVSQQMTGVDSQHLETRRFQIEEVCRGQGVLPIMVGYSDKAATYASAQAFMIAHVVNTMAPLYECIEQSIAAFLLSPADIKDGIYAKFTEEALLRGSPKEAADLLLELVNGGLMKPNEGRAKLDLPRDDDPDSDKLRIPVTAAQVPEEDPAVAEAGDTAKKAMQRLEVLEARFAERKDTPTTINVAPPSVNVSSPDIKAPISVTIADGAVQSHTTVEGANVKTGDTKVETPSVTVNGGGPRVLKRVVTRDEAGDLTGRITHYADGTQLREIASIDADGNVELSSVN